MRIKQKLLLSFIILLTLIITSSPFIFGLIDTPPNMSYIGTHLINSADTFAYYGLYTQASHGKIIFFNPYTPEKHFPIFFRPSFSISTFILKTIHINSIQSYHLFRIIFSILLLITLYFFAKLFFGKNKHILFIYSFIIFGSGTGWFLINITKDPLDLWIPETNIFLSLMEAPHFQLSLTLILIIFIFWLKNNNQFTFRNMAWASFFSILLFFCHPFDAPLIYLTFFIYIFTCIFLNGINDKKNTFFCLALFLAISSLPIIWQSYMVKTNLIAKYWAIQNINTSPSLLGFISGLGIWLPLGLIGGIYSIKNKDYKFILLFSWAISYLFLIYLPINMQRRFLEGLFIPYILLSCYFIFEVLPQYNLAKKYNKKYMNICLLVFLLLASSFSNLILLKRDFVSINNNKTLPFYSEKKLILGLKWLQNYDGKLKTTLANWDISYFSPTYLYGQTFWGHRVQTIKLYQKEKEINNYFLNKLNKNERKYFYVKYNIQYLIWDKSDNNKPYNPENDSYLNKIYDNNRIQIYKTTLNSAHPSPKKGLSTEACLR